MSEKIINGLLAMGCVEVSSKSRKYRQFRVPNRDGDDRFYFVGKAGALRWGRCATDTIALSSAAKDRVMAKVELEGVS